jgi:protein involved in polysaccharide export with SLBB domain
MKAEYEKLQKGEISSQNLNTDLDEFNPKIGTPNQAQIIPYDLIEKDSIHIGSYYFGYDFFTQRDTIKFWENLPPPTNYLLGPGDELVVSLWGEAQLRKTYIISRDGTIYDERVGLLSMMGKTIDDSEDFLLNQFGRVFATLKGPKPSTYIDISLGKLRSINVNFVGEVIYPGIYPVHPFSSVITGLIQAGGVDTTGSLRNIQIKRNGKEYALLDLYDYLIKGNLSKNIQLRDQDIVVVPIRQSTITIDSAVVRPGIYEAIPGETVKQIISYSGGFKPNASGTIGLKRIIPFDKRSVTQSSIENYYVDYTNSELLPIQNGDVITAETIFTTLNQVEIIGQVKKPGVYFYYSGMRIKDLIELAGGFNDTSFWKSVYQERGELVRRNPKTRYESVIDINLKNIINGDTAHNVLLQNLDRFVVHANLNFFETENVQILGEVNIPGSYPLISDNETLNSVLNRAGNLTSKALKNGISIYRDKKYIESNKIKEPKIINQDGLTNNIYENNIYENNITSEKVRVAWQNQSITLMPGDSVIVKEITGTVNISGEVYNPGLIEFQEGKSLKYYIDLAGGTTIDGNKNDVIVIYANGLVKPKKLFNSPRIHDGSTIIVNKKAIKEPFDITTFASSMLSIISTTVTILVLSKQLNAG